jgi:hypothetical protein
VVVLYVDELEAQEAGVRPRAAFRLEKGNLKDAEIGLTANMVLSLDPLHSGGTLPLRDLFEEPTGDGGRTTLLDHPGLTGFVRFLTF